jgi:hypothetical protein
MTSVTLSIKERNLLEKSGWEIFARDMGQLLVLQNSTAWAEQLDFIEYSSINLWRIKETAVKENMGRSEEPENPMTQEGNTQAVPISGHKPVPPSSAASTATTTLFLFQKSIPLNE